MRQHNIGGRTTVQIRDNKRERTPYVIVRSTQKTEHFFVQSKEGSEGVTEETGRAMRYIQSLKEYRNKGDRASKRERPLHRERSRRPAKEQKVLSPSFTPHKKGNHY